MWLGPLYHCPSRTLSAVVNALGGGGVSEQVVDRKTGGLAMPNIHDVNVSVLGFREDGEWCALALEMDLRGYGETFEAATEDLHASIAMQISFAVSKDQPSMIFHPAEPVYFSLFAQVRNDRLHSLAAGQVSTSGPDTIEDEYAVAGLPMPPGHVIAAWEGGGRVA